MPLTDKQRDARARGRALFEGAPSPLGKTESFEERARHPNPVDVPADVTFRVEIAPPTPHPHPLLDTGALKTPERVPVYFYTLRDGLAESEVADTRVIIFIHGGGNIAGHPTEGYYIYFYSQLLRAFASHSGSASKCVLIAPSYRLATVPENTFPAALQDLVAVYDHVLSKGYKASNIVIAGDSAGGNHAIVLTHLILQSDRPPPHGIVPIAPMSIQTFDGMSERAKSHSETDILTLRTMERSWNAYVGDTGVALTDPLVSGAYIPFTASWPKVLILVGSGDVLIDAVHEIKKRLSALERPVELVEYDERPHGWWVMPDAFLEDSEDAARRIARFLL